MDTTYAKDTVDPLQREYGRATIARRGIDIEVIRMNVFIKEQKIRFRAWDTGRLRVVSQRIGHHESHVLLVLNLDAIATRMVSFLFPSRYNLINI